MAIIPVHKAITKEALQAFKFVSKAIERAADANAAVDEKQGDDASQTNLHAMRGYVLAPDPISGGLTFRAAPPPPFAGTLSTGRTNGGVPLGLSTTSKRSASLLLGTLQLSPDPLASMGSRYRLQTEDEVKAAVTALLTEAHDDVVRALLKRDYEEALTRLGQALHTVQDRVFHHFEPWPYKDIADSLLNSPNYMMCHALRDTGYISKVAVSEHQFALGVATRADPDTYLGAEAFAPLGDQTSMTQGFRGWGGMVTITFGAAPGSLRPPDTTPGREPQRNGDSAQSCLATEGVADKAKATDDSEKFIADIQKEVERKDKGAEIWNDFLQLKSGH
jgi:hypothetical protein